MLQSNITKCAITGIDLKAGQLKPTTSATIEYQTDIVGNVRISLSAYNELLKGSFDRFTIAGICKHRTIQGKEPILIDSEFIRGNYKDEHPPKEFDEKLFELNKILYQLYGKENKKFDLYGFRDFPLGYANPEEFIRLVDKLYDDKKIDYHKRHIRGRDGGAIMYTGVKVTNIGKSDALKGLPKMPMFRLVSQEITTGNRERDEQINHARSLFFDTPQTSDKMRSACETLSYVIEPLRNELNIYFNSSDVSDFFQLVNRFDIRHNKSNTIKLIEPEQLEWVFYTLLNTINTYSKLKGRGK